jgi:hypothetical protein
MRTHASFDLLLTVLLAFPAAVWLLIPPPAAAGGWPLPWQNSEVVDSGVSDLSPGTPLVHAPVYPPWNGVEQWHALYAKDGEIWRRIRTADGWGDPERLTFGPADSRDPQAAFAGGELIAVWEDDRTGHAEIWSRRWDGASWSPEECLSEDAVPSRFPALSGGESGALVAWEDQVPGARSIRGRLRAGGAWGPVQAISQSAAEAVQPSVARLEDFHPQGGTYFVAWSDTRSPNASIYARPWTAQGSLQPEFRITDLSGISEKPTIRAGFCCGDVLNEVLILLFENTAPGGVPETWSVYVENRVPGAPARLSAEDGIVSEDPSLIDFTYRFEMAPHFYVGTLHSYATWREDARDTCHPLERFPYLGEAEPLGDLGAGCPSNALLAVFDPDPFATVAALWTEERDGSTTLVFRSGRTMSCWGPDADGAHPFVVAPEGWPADTVAVVTHCSGRVPVPDVLVSLSFDGVAVWDQSQPHPETPPHISDSEGQAMFSVRGGGCVPWGQVSVKVNGVVVKTFGGIASPDINGDCIVDNVDLSLIRFGLGTSDFCGDLDGSGLVTEEDVAIVQATMWTRCSQISGIGDPGGGGRNPLTVRVIPNPSTGVTVLRLDLPGPRLVHAWLAGAGGRLVRDLGSREFGEGTALLTWDGRDDAGRPVPSGVYFALVRAGGESFRNTVLVAR